MNQLGTKKSWFCEDWIVGILWDGLLMVPWTPSDEFN